MQSCAQGAHLFKDEKNGNKAGWCVIWRGGVTLVCAVVYLQLSQATMCHGTLPETTYWFPQPSLASLPLTPYLAPQGLDLSKGGKQLSWYSGLCTRCSLSL